VIRDGRSRIYELVSRPTPLGLFALVANLCIVTYMARVRYGGNRDALS
jgi:uncharacterized membrane protein (DUF2068 family)